MSEDIRELAERAEEATEHSGLAPVTVTMAILAVLVAAVSLLGHRAHTEEIILQNKATDQWAYYQAKEIRRRSYELFVDEVSVFALQSGEQASQIKEKYQRKSSDIKRKEKTFKPKRKKPKAKYLSSSTVPIISILAKFFSKRLS